MPWNHWGKFLFASSQSRCKTQRDSCSAIFRTRIDEARIKLSFAEKRIQEYDDLGPEMETIFAAYAGILDEIDKTEDDICKIRQSR